MSTVSANSPSKREKVQSDLTQELESVRAMNSSLRAYLEHLRGFKKNLLTINNNYVHLSKVNSQWIDIVKQMK